MDDPEQLPPSRCRLNKLTRKVSRRHAACMRWLRQGQVCQLAQLVPHKLHCISWVNLSCPHSPAALPLRLHVLRSTEPAFLHPRRRSRRLRWKGRGRPRRATARRTSTTQRRQPQRRQRRPARQQRRRRQRRRRGGAAGCTGEVAANACCTAGACVPIQPAVSLPCLPCHARFSSSVPSANKRRSPP